MPSVLLLPPENSPPRLRRGSWWVLGACGLVSLLLHLMLVWLWPGYGGSGIKMPRVRASFRLMPVLPMPVAPGVAAPSTPETPAHDAALPRAAADTPRTALPAKPSVDTIATQQTGPEPSQDEAGGGLLSAYQPVEILDTRPRFLVDMREYIPASLDATESGRIVVQMLIGAEGEVDGVVLEKSELTPRATRRFLQRLDALKLLPGLLDGQPVKARWRMEFDFSPATD